MRTVEGENILINVSWLAISRNSLSKVKFHFK